MNNILIIGAHYDDTELGAGGTAAKLVGMGKKVYKLTLTDNETDFKQRNVSVSKDTSYEQGILAGSCLGIETIDFSPVKCSHLEYNKDIMQRVESVIYKYNIDTVFIHFGVDMNQDHVAANKICLTASRHCKNILEYQSNGYILDDVFYPTFFVDISDFVEAKKEALSKYGSEHDRNNRLFMTNIERNHIWGFANEVEYAEGFRIVKMLR